MQATGQVDTGSDVPPLVRNCQSVASNAVQFIHRHKRSRTPVAGYKRELRERDGLLIGHGSDVLLHRFFADHLI